MITPSLTTSIYIIAHADDWQLFMNPDAFHDINCPDSKVVFIVTTAGDAGKPETYWRAREEGMKNSIKFCLTPFSDLLSDHALKNIDGISFHVYSFNNVSCYFLRLPDGGLEGRGFPSNEYQSLSKLRAGQISSLMSLDHSLAVNGWLQFVKILESIVLVESRGALTTFLKYLDPEESSNPHDHPDHRETGAALFAIRSSVYSHSLFAGYQNSCSEMMSPHDVFWKVGIFAAYDSSVYEECGYSTIGEDPQLYQKWCTTKSQRTHEFSFSSRVS
jgi:hypothetical protein